jgi:hypothetical protein
MKVRSRSIVSAKKAKVKMVRGEEPVAGVPVEVEAVADVVVAVVVADRKLPLVMKANFKMELKTKEIRRKKDHVEEMVVPEEAQTGQTLYLRK